MEWITIASAVLGAAAKGGAPASTMSGSQSGFDNSQWSIIFGNGNIEATATKSPASSQADWIGYAMLALLMLGALVIVKR